LLQVAHYVVRRSKAVKTDPRVAVESATTGDAQQQLIHAGFNICCHMLLPRDQLCWHLFHQLPSSTAIAAWAMQPFFPTVQLPYRRLTHRCNDLCSCSRQATSTPSNKHGVQHEGIQVSNAHRALQHQHRTIPAQTDQQPPGRGKTQVFSLSQKVRKISSCRTF
jgi:hypothetical protein